MEPLSLSPVVIYIYIYWKKLYIYIYYTLKNPRRARVHAPRLEPAAPIRLADRNHAHYPSCRRTIPKKRWFSDGLQAHAIWSTPESSEDVTRTLDAHPSKVHSDIFPHSWRTSSQKKCQFKRWVVVLHQQLYELHTRQNNGSLCGLIVVLVCWCMWMMSYYTHFPVPLFQVPS